MDRLEWAGRWVRAGLCLVLLGCVPGTAGGSGSAGAAGEGTPAPVEGSSGEPRGAGAADGESPTLQEPEGPPGPRESRPPPSSCAPTPGQAIVDAVNRIRRDAGLEPLQVDARLVQAARSHTDDMARRDRLGHDGSDGREVQHRAEALGYDWLLIAENVASGQPTVADAMGSWMDSPGHRRNILAPGTRHMGAAARASSGGRMYWTQVFGNTEVRVPPAGECHP